MVKKNELIQLTIDEVGFPNKARGKYEGYSVKFKGGIEGQQVMGRVAKKGKDFLNLKAVNVIQRSPLETEEGCSHFGICGGCTYQKLSYENELKLKEKQVRRLFSDEGIDINYLGIERSPIVEGYRNKMEYTFGDEGKDGPLALGLNRRGRFYEVAKVEECNIAHDDFTKILSTVLEYFQEINASFYKKTTHTGFLRHLVIRKAISTGEILINLVTTSQSQLPKGFASSIMEGFMPSNGKIVGILHTINDGLADIIRADKIDLLYGKDYIVEEILGLKFKISPFSFFQTNTLGAIRLYSIVREFVGDIEDQIVFDLYSGTGTIAQILAPLAKKVIGIEIVEEAVENAHKNAILNNIDNVEFIAGDVLKAIDELEDKPDLIVIDPPRDGIHPRVVDKIIDFNPKRIVYVSCNPITLVRDLKVFINSGYKVDKLKLMDMFPRTSHVESIILMTSSTSEAKK